jgi:D-glycero-D-manno-heptose 1,7-bisphosphate phosphatase
MIARKAVFLDRDGVLNRVILRDGRPCPPRDVSEFELLPGAAEACHLLREIGFVLIVVTNQPDVARGTQSIGTIGAMHRRLRRFVELDDICVCPHDDFDDCRCRKPRPGLLIEAAQNWRINLAGSFMVGDRWRDIGAGRAAGCRTVYIDSDYAEPRPVDPDHTASSLAQAARWILTSAPTPEALDANPS